jgi:hypothetical protein
MKIDICLMACNNNQKYYSFFPYVKQIWEKKLGIKCILIFIGNEIPDCLNSLKEDIVLFEPIENMHSSFIAQNIRLLYPALLDCNNAVIIADIDIIPLSKQFFIGQIDQYSNELFINYNWKKICEDIKEYYMCYNVALPQTWSKVFNVNKKVDIINILKQWYNKITYIYDDRYRSKCRGFHNDQLMLYKYLNDYESKNKNHLILLETQIRRFDMGIKINNKQNLINDIQNDLFDDCHFNKKIKKEELLLFL